MQVTLINSMGTDDTVCDAARVSFNREALSFSPEQNERLIRYLAKHNHFTPFTHCMITVREKVPIFVARQRFKHTVGFSYNEISRRYIDEPPEFYTPDVWRKRAENKKQGSSDETIRLNDVCLDRTYEGNFGDIEGEDYFYSEVIKLCTDFYNEAIRMGVAPEQARMVLPQSMFTEYYVTGSLSAFARAYYLRSEESAQKEIQDLATEWDKIIRPLFPKSWSALVDH